MFFIYSSHSFFFCFFCSSYILIIFFLYSYYILLIFFFMCGWGRREYGVAGVRMRWRACMHMCARVCTCVRIHVLPWVGERAKMHTHMRFCRTADTRVHAHACTCVHACARVCAGVCGRGWACVHTRARVCTRVRGRV